MDYKLYNINGSESSKKFKLNKKVYGIKPNEETITLVKESWTPEAQFTAGDVNIVPLRAGEEILWKIK